MRAFHGLTAYRYASFRQGLKLVFFRYNSLRACMHQPRTPPFSGRVRYPCRKNGLLRRRLRVASTLGSMAGPRRYLCARCIFTRDSNFVEENTSSMQLCAIGISRRFADPGGLALSELCCAGYASRSYSRSLCHGGRTVAEPCKEAGGSHCCMEILDVL